MIAVPLISKDEVIGVLHVRSKEVDYTERDLSLAERVGHQIAGAIGNAQLFTERKKAEEALQKSEGEAKRLAQENEWVAEIGRIIGSNLNIEEVYERFVEELHKLIFFDWLSINTINLKDNITTGVYMTGVKILGTHGNSMALSGTLSEEILQTRSSLFIQMKDREEWSRRFPQLLKYFEAGFQSMVSIPLISKDEVIGALHLRSKEVDYTERDLSLAERVGSQITGAIANSQLFAERRQE